MKLFTITNGTIAINTPEVLLINDFKAILDRDPTVGKVNAWNEFKFIYHLVDPMSVPNQRGYNEASAIAFAKRECGYDESFVPDRILTKAIAKYAELRSSIVAEVCQELLISFRTSSEILKKMRNRMDDILAKSALTTDDIREVINLQKEIISMASGIPENITKITTAQAELEKSNDKLLRGKRTLKDSMNPTTALG